MNQLELRQSAEIEAPADRVYALLADYRHGHPKILPPKTFLGIDVDTGGVGAGTQFRLRSRMLGVERTMRLAVSEPQPGRVLAETDLDSDLRTTFTVDPLPGGRANVTLHTVWAPQRGVLGLIERFVVRGLLQKVYVQELALLADVLRPAGEVAVAVR